MISLGEKNDIWLGLPQETPEQQLWADNYYDKELIPLAQDDFCARYTQAVPQTYYGLFVLLGPAWERSAFVARLLEPQNLHVICIQEYMAQFRRLVENLGWDEERCLCTTVSRGDTAGVYRVIHKQQAIWESMGQSAIDYSGGSQLLRLAAAQIAGTMSIDGYFVQTRYVEAQRRHLPGTEKLITLPRVQTVLPELG